MGDYIFKFNEIGELKIERILFESYYPILFTCSNEKKEDYLCVCCTVTPQYRKWLITKIVPTQIIDLLTDKITIREAFLSGKGKYTIYYLRDEKYEIQEDNEEDWDPENSIYLPTAGEYMDADEDEFLDDIIYYENKQKQIEDKIKNITWDVVTVKNNQSWNYTIDVKPKQNQQEIAYMKLLASISEYSYSINELIKNNDISKTKTYSFSLHNIKKENTFFDVQQMLYMSFKNEEVIYDEKINTKYPHEDEGYPLVGDSILSIAS